jgi:hypothetical protein
MEGAMWERPGTGLAVTGRLWDAAVGLAARRTLECIADAASDAGGHAHVVLTTRTGLVGGSARGNAGVARRVPKALAACPSPSESHLDVGHPQTPSLLHPLPPAAALADASWTGAHLLHFYCSRSPPWSNRCAAASGPCAISPRFYSRHAHGTDWTASAPIAEHSGYFVTTKTRPIMVYGNLRYIIKAMAKVYENQATV